MTSIYFDNAATTPLSKEVLNAIIEVLETSFGNPSSIHAAGRKAKGLIEEARVNIAKNLKCLPSEIYFTSGGTESNNIALRKAVHCLGVKNIITTAIEHHAVITTAEDIVGLNNNINLHLLAVDNKGCFKLEDLENLLTENANCLVSIMHANNELGNLNDIKSIGELCKKHQAYFHTDAVQTIGYQDLDLVNANIDMLSASAHKFNGPKGIGFLYLKKGIPIKGFITGGGQERNLRAGTENVPFIVGMAKALELCYGHLEEKRAHISGLRTYFMEQVTKLIPRASFNGDFENSNYTVINVGFPLKEASDMFLFNLDLRGISASGGSACSSGASKGSHVSHAIGLPSGQSNIRFSFGIYNTKAEINHCIEVIGSLVNLTPEKQAI